MKIIAVIPARGGSKGIPGKNIKPLAGKPLIEYTIDKARAVFKDLQIIVSTDDLNIKNVVENMDLQVPFLRPDYLATDTAGTYEVLLHALTYYESAYERPEILVLLQPTSPFRTSKQIEEAIALYQKSKNIDMVVSVCASKSNPYYNLFEENTEGYLKVSKNGNFTRRQDCPKVWEYNGAIYVINVASLKKMPLNQFNHIIKYEMDEFSSLDLDTTIDWQIAEEITQKLRQ